MFFFYIYTDLGMGKTKKDKCRQDLKQRASAYL